MVKLQWGWAVMFGLGREKRIISWAYSLTKSGLLLQLFGLKGRPETEAEKGYFLACPYALGFMMGVCRKVAEGHGMTANPKIGAVSLKVFEQAAGLTAAEISQSVGSYFGSKDPIFMDGFGDGAEFVLIVASDDLDRMKKSSERVARYRQQLFEGALVASG
jgi:hypothetical protein